MSKLPAVTKNVLLVDDEKDIVVFLEHFLKRFKITSVAVSSGEDAIDLYGRAVFDLVFLDIQLKGINGLEVLEQLSTKYKNLRVIMITGKTEKELQEKAKTLGALDYITKPLDLGELKEKITRYLT